MFKIHELQTRKLGLCSSEILRGFCIPLANMKEHRLERDPLKTNFLVDDTYMVKKKIWKEELIEREITSKIRTFKNHNME
jgi:hypothetical protein